MGQLLFHEIFMLTLFFIYVTKNLRGEGGHHGKDKERGDEQ